MSNQPLTKIQASTAAEVCARFDLAKDAKPLKEAYLKNAKEETDPKKRQEKWDEIMDAFAKTSKDLAVAAAKDGATQKQAKDLFQSVKKTCSDCHTVFRVESEF